MTKKVLISLEDIDKLYVAKSKTMSLTNFWAAYARCIADLIEWFNAQPGVKDEKSTD